MLLPAALPPLRAMTAEDARGLSDDELLAEQRAFAVARRLIDAGAAAIAAEIAVRSSRELGHDGLAQKRGVRTPEALVATLTGLSTRDSRTLVDVGALVARPRPGHEPLGAAVRAGLLSVEAARLVQSALGEADRVPADRVRRAAAALIEEAPGLTLEQLAARARTARAELDTSGVPAREEELRQRRFLALTPQPDGMTRVSGLLDPESAAIITTAIDAATSPRRGGPRFVDEATAPALPTDDSRTVPQLMADALVDLVVIATRADDGAVLGARRVGVRVHVTLRDLTTGEGYASIEGQGAPVSIDTARRFACDSGVVPLLFDTDGSVLNVGREQRLHTPRMRIALAARDGGCVIPSCARPPDWCEAHHINQWQRDEGGTSVDDGVLLCRHHHQALHHHGWSIRRNGADYVLHRPGQPSVPVQQRNPVAARRHSEPTVTRATAQARRVEPATPATRTS